ncbi:MAG: PKD domain-containing protein [Thermoplasmata archaeon]|nr:PKD domain-containing protein [Thermoplasmata archaeon]
MGVVALLGVLGLVLGLLLSGGVYVPAVLHPPFGLGSPAPPRTDQRQAMSANASATPLSGVAPLPVTFQGSVARATAPFSVAWSFGDSNSSTELSPSHSYDSAGTYIATFQVTDASGATASSSVQVVVAAPGLSASAAALVTGSVVAVTPGTFWSVDAQTSCATCISSSTAVTGYLASVPFTWVRYGQGTDECNISVDRSYSPDGVASTGCGFDLSSLKTWCDSTTPHCHSILNLPGENNNSREDAAIAKWIVRTVGFQPDYWSIGNEPTGWTHYGIAWNHWKSTDNSPSSPLAYAYDVKSAMAAVKAVDPGAKFIGIEAACSCNTLWFQDVAKVDGPGISALAVHVYPSSWSATETLAQFDAPLAGPDNVTGSVAAVHAAAALACTGCGKLPVFVNEFNAGPGWTPSNHAGTYANAVFLAASVAQALTGNVSQLTVFDLESSSTTEYGYALLGYHGTPGPSGSLFSGILAHMARGSVTADHVSTVVPNVWAVTTTNATTESILVVNANPTHSIDLSLGLHVVATGLATVFHWNSTLSGPLKALARLATGYTVPSQGILLVNLPRTFLLVGALAPPSPASAVQPAGLGVATGTIGGLPVEPMARPAGQAVRAPGTDR